METLIQVDYRCPKGRNRKGTCHIVVRCGGREEIIPTEVRVYPYEWDERQKMIAVDGGVTAERQRELQEGQYALEEELLTLGEVVRELEAEQGRFAAGEIVRERERWRLRQSFFCLLEWRIRRLKETGQWHTADNYRCALNAFREFRHRKDIATTELNSNVVKEFQKYLVRKGLAMNTVSLYNRNLRAAYNYAVDEELVKEDKRPFGKVFTGLEKTRKRAVKEVIVKRLIALPLSGSLELARDIFVFSIYTQGMAFVDVAHLQASNLRPGKLYYQRSKTHQRLEISLLPCMEELIGKYRQEGSENPYLFPLLYNERKRKPIGYATALREYNARLLRLSERMGLEKPLTSHTARHTWASLAKQLGVDETVISEAMGHRNLETTTIYLDSLDEEVISSANRSVVSTLLR